MNKQDRDCIETMHNYMLSDDDYLQGDRVEINHICLRLEKLSQLEEVLEKYDMNNIKKLSVHLELLRELTNIKNELGIDLVTLFNALKNGIYHKWKYNGEIEAEKIKISYFDISSLIQEKYYYDANERLKTHYYFDDYGKTWALTREELL